MTPRALDTWKEKSLKTAWHDFVCAFVAFRTSRKPAAGYTLRAVDGAWVLSYMGSPCFAPMSASTAYSWFVRTPGVCSLAKLGDDVRTAAYLESEGREVPAALTLSLLCE